MKRYSNALAIVACGIFVLTLGAMLALCFLTITKVENAANNRKYCFRLLLSADQLLQDLTDAETAQRGFLLTKSEIFLHSFYPLQDSVANHFAHLRNSTRNIYAQKELDRLLPLITGKMIYLSETIQFRKNAFDSSGISSLLQVKEKNLMDSIRATKATFTTIEKTALEKYDTDLTKDINRLFIIISLISLFMLLLVIVCVIYIYRAAKNYFGKELQNQTQHLLDIQKTTNKQLEQINTALLISNATLAVTLNSIGDGVIATDSLGIVTFINPVGEKLTGFSQKNALGNSFQKIFLIIHEETRKPQTNPIVAALSEGTIQFLENHTILVAADGSERAIEDSCAPIRNPEGIVVGAVLVFRDVSESRSKSVGLEKIYKELETSKKSAEAASEFADSLINTIREPLLSLDGDLRVVTVSRSFYEFFKVSPQETVGKLIYDLGNKQWDIPKLRELLETILPQKASFDNYEVEHDFASIGRRVMHLNARQIVRDASHKRIILLAIEDITERKNTENELLKTKNELERIVIAQKVVITDTKESLNIETKERLYEASEISHRQEALEVVYAMGTAFDFNIESLYDQIVLSIASTLRSSTASIYEYRDGKILRFSKCHENSITRNIPHVTPCAFCRSILNSKLPVQLSITRKKDFEADICFDTTHFQSFLGIPIIGVQGEIRGMITILDTQERIFNDSEIKFIETFARYIAHELSRRDLEWKMRRGEEMRMIGQLTSGVAHEVRNPLNGIMAIMGALTKELSTSTSVSVYLGHMRSQVSRLKELMDGLLDLGRPIREENMQEMLLIDLIQNSITSWLQTTSKDASTVIFEPLTIQKLLFVKVEPLSVTQMLINVLDNANQHSLTEQIIHINIRELGPACVSILFVDSGSGIPVEILPRIFEPFFTSRKGGTGLGLSIVRHIAENHQGSIQAYNNTDGPGATFEIILPCYKIK